MTYQNGEGIRADGPVSPGGTIEVDVGPNDSTVQVSDGTAQGTKSFRVTPGKRSSIPVPLVPPGSQLSVTVGKGLRRRTVLVEVIAPSP